jgi:hypothetical protein
MAAIKIVFSGLMMFASPDNGQIMVTAVTGKANEVHGAWIKRGEEKRAFKGEVQLKGATGKVMYKGTGFEENVPSVTAALAGTSISGLQALNPSPCVQSPAGGGCLYRNGYLKLIGGRLSASAGSRNYYFKVGSAGKYHVDMAHEVVWTGEAEAILIGDEEWKLQPGDEITITNHPQTSSGRHFGVLRHLWNASDNDTDENWPLPISDHNLRGLLEGLMVRKSGGKALSDGELLSAFLEVIMIPSRPIFCPPARQ